MNNNFFSQVPDEDFQRQLARAQRNAQIHNNQRRRAPNNNAGMNLDTTNQANSVSGDPLSGDSLSAISADISMVGSGSDSLDEIIRQNRNELHRRRSVPQSFSADLTAQDAQDEADRRMSMMAFATTGDGFQDFSYPDLAGGPDSGLTGGFGDMGNGMDNGMDNGMTPMPGHSSAFSQSSLMAMSDSNGYPNLSPDMMGNMMAFSSLSMGQMTADPSSLSLFGTSGLGNQFSGGLNTDFPMDMTGVEDVPLSATSANPTTVVAIKDEAENMMGVEQSFGTHGSDTPQRPGSLLLDPSLGPFGPPMAPPPLSREVAGSTTFQSPGPSGTPSQAVSQMSGVSQPTISAPTPTPMTPANSLAPIPGHQAINDLYSKSGFDMLKALWKVATRRITKKSIQLGAVDMSCAFVVCDVTLNDCPIIYVSDNFQNLTGYSRHEIMGQNCRFLQAPDGRVEAGSKREFVENHAVYMLKQKIAAGEEVQQSLINYRKGGKPFLNLLTMIPITWDTDEIQYIIGFQIDLVECPDAIARGQGGGTGVQVNYKHSDIGQYIWTPPNSTQWEPENGQTLSIDDVSTLLQQHNPKGQVSDWHKQTWDKMLLENADDVVHVLSLKGLFLYLSPSCKKILEYDTADLLGNSLSSICHPSDIVPVTRELKDAQPNAPVNVVFRIRRRNSGYTWFESHGTLLTEHSKGRKCIVLVGRKRPVFALRKRDLEANGGIGDSEIWTKVSTSGMFLFVSSNVRSLLDLLPESLEGTSMQDLMRKESRAEFGRTIEKARRGKIASCKHEVQNKRGQVLQAHTTFYPGDASEGQRPTFLLAQTKLLKASSRAIAPATGSKSASGSTAGHDEYGPTIQSAGGGRSGHDGGILSAAGGTVHLGSQDVVLAADDNIFEELKTTRCTSWQYELRQMEKMNRLLAEDLAQLLASRKKRKRRKGGGNMVRDCANCHTRNTPEWRRGPSGNRDLCNSCGLRWAKQTGRVSPRNSSRGGNGDTQSKKSNSPIHSSPLQRETPTTNKTTPPSVLDHNKSPASQHTPLPPSASPSAPVPVNINASNSSSPPVPLEQGASSSSNNNTQSNNTAGSSTGKAQLLQAGLHHPPQSQPMLEGGSGLRGGGMEMTSIREEREMSA